MSDDHRYPPVSPLSAGLAGRCPRCGQGRLFTRWLDTAPKCDQCGLDYSFIDSADGPAVFVILVVGIIVVGLAFFVEFTYQPPYWLHLILWIPLILLLSIGMLRPLKGLLIAQQYVHKAQEGRLVRDDEEPRGD
ncbi:DUF983 domain-containing protein [Microbaculum marinisediminis]|uniref:DUF983 domain-containing protein n=1 Tax=Microbaculum marinisediminis TaxID=2931392 RepID=A0AAW5QQJ7_9HYPH|nr:DUF983 domain-containing protein [Microbaculum sp. A6E488]MCT8970346.1 DUF983 domain-containing protein [Microbaculum sp. A6E488]